MNNKLITNDKVVIYGAGKIGQLVLNLCNDYGIKNIQVWDNYPDRVIEFDNKDIIVKPPSFEGNKVASDYDLQDAMVIITIFSPDVSKRLATPLLSKGFKDVVYDRSDVSELLVNHCKWLEENKRYQFDLADCFTCPARRDDKVECDLFNSNYGITIDNDSKPVIFPVLGLLLTTKCNLTCTGCNHLLDHFDKSQHININYDVLLSDLNKLLESVDFIKSIVVVGGEPFMYPEFEEVISYLLTVKKIGFVQVITNGTVMPRKDSLYKLLSNKRIVVEVSGYGDKIGDKKIRQRDKLIDMFIKNNIRYHYDEASQWFDFGGFDKRSFGTEGQKRVYKTCCFISNDLLDGKLHKCSRSAYGLFLGKTPNYKNDYIDIRLTNHSNLRDEFVKFFEMVPMACFHCDGTTGAIIPAGIQVEQKKIKAHS